MTLDIESLPLILAGPILRRTEPTSVTVWVALKESKKVYLELYDDKEILIERSLEHQTIALGKHLHVVAVTISLKASSILSPSKIYLYNLFFDALSLKDVPINEVLTYGYGGYELPSFALPPDNLNHLRIIHASCRKPHGQGFDALEAIDQMLVDSATTPLHRPHQLFLTGDQIYADDVADIFLNMLTHVGEALLDWQETLPQINKKLLQLPYGERADVAEDTAKLTSGEAKSHLFGFAEFCAMYLCVWSNVLWVDGYCFSRDEQNQTSYKKLKSSDETKRLEVFKNTVPKIRRALANIPTYMIFDDHDVTDDWYLHQEWAVNVLTSQFGSRVLMNGLLAYAVFQAWGNTPDQFVEGRNGRQLLTKLSEWINGQNHEKQLKELVGMPTPTSVERLKRLQPPPNALKWHYTVTGNRYHVIVLDTRLWRAFPDQDDDPSELIAQEGFEAQVPNILPPDIELLFVVNATPPIGVPLVDFFQDIPVLTNEYADREAWRLQVKAFELLFAKLAILSEQCEGYVVMLSGDVHHGFALRLEYRGLRPFMERLSRREPAKMVIAQLTASALKNETWTTRRLHNQKYERGFPKIDAGFVNFTNYLPTPILRFAYHGDSPSLVDRREIELTTEGYGIIFDDIPNPDWLYRYDFIVANIDKLTHKTHKLPNKKKERLESYKTISQLYADYTAKWIGQDIVGVNNLGEVTLSWQNTNKAIIQQLWWHSENDNVGISPRTRYQVSLDFNDPNYPLPDYTKREG